MNQVVYPYEKIKNDILEAVDLLANPIKQTISPKGRNVIFQDSNGNVHSTNDGVTIAKNIVVRDPIKNAIIDIVKSAALKTNSEVGDGTSTSILLSQVLIKEGFKLIENGLNPMEVKREFERFGCLLIEKLKKLAVKVKSDNDLFNVALVSSNNDKNIAEDVVRVIKTAGLDGMVFIESNNKSETEIIEDTGFIIESGMFHPELKSSRGRFSADYKNVPVLITDKRIYYPEEAETILKTALLNGYKDVVIVARDFIGQSINTFLANHIKGVINVLLVKDSNASDKNAETLQDLASYLSGKVITEKTGDIVNKLSISDFSIARRVYSDLTKTIIQSEKSSKDLQFRISAIRRELEKDKENKELKKRLASLTTGMVTVKIGGATQIEVAEKVYRFEDAINAVRATLRDGWLPGGGISIKAAFDSIKPSEYPSEFKMVYKRYSEANIRQIAENCGKHADTLIDEIEAHEKGYGYNAVTNCIEDLGKIGIIDPYKVTEMAVANSISVAGQIISSGFLIVNDIEDNNNDNKNFKKTDVKK